MLNGLVRAASSGADYLLDHTGCSATMFQRCDSWERQGAFQKRRSHEWGPTEYADLRFTFDSAPPTDRIADLDEEFRSIVQFVTPQVITRLVAAEHVRLVETDGSIVSCRYYRESLAIQAVWPSGSVRRISLEQYGKCDWLAQLSGVREALCSGYRPMSLLTGWKLLLKADVLLQRLGSLFCSADALSRFSNAEFSREICIVDSGVHSDGVAFRPFDDAGVVRLTPTSILTGGHLSALDESSGGNRFIGEDGLFSICPKGLTVLPESGQHRSLSDIPGYAVVVDVAPQVSFGAKGDLRMQLEGCPVYLDGTLEGHIPHAQVCFRLDELFGVQMDGIVSDRDGRRIVVTVGEFNLVSH